MWYSIAALACGAVGGALCRWLLTACCGGTFLSFGMLAANWGGAFLIGLLAEWVQHPQLKLLLLTGFLGSLTTFSGFSLEVLGLMQTQRWAEALATAALHLFGSLALTAAGIYLAQALKNMG